MLTTIASSAVRSQNSIPGRGSFLQSHRGALMGASRAPRATTSGPPLCCFSHTSLPRAASCLGNDWWKRNRSRSHHERRGGKDCGELSCLRRAGLAAGRKGSNVLVLCAAAGTADTVRGNRGTLVLPDVPAEAD